MGRFLVFDQRGTLLTVTERMDTPLSDTSPAENDAGGRERFATWRVVIGTTAILSSRLNLTPRTQRGSVEPRYVFRWGQWAAPRKRLNRAG